MFTKPSLMGSIVSGKYGEGREMKCNGCSKIFSFDSVVAWDSGVGKGVSDGWRRRNDITDTGPNSTTDYTKTKEFVFH